MEQAQKEGKTVHLATLMVLNSEFDERFHITWRRCKNTTQALTLWSPSRNLSRRT